MHDIYQTFFHCCTLLDEMGIRYGDIVSLTVNTRAQKRWGQCKNQGWGQFAINISEKLLQDNVDIKHLETTMLHEILHTCYGCMNHGKTWKKYATLVNRRYGYNIKRCTSFAEKGIEPPKPKPYKYTVTCNGCARHWNFRRARRWFNVTDGATCPCGCTKFEIVQHH